MLELVPGYDVSDLIAVVAAVNMITGALLPLIPRNREKEKAGGTNWRKTIGRFGAIGVGLAAGLLLAILPEGIVAGAKVGLVAAWAASGAHNTPGTITDILKGLRGTATTAASDIVADLGKDPRKAIDVYRMLRDDEEVDTHER